MTKRTSKSRSRASSVEDRRKVTSQAKPADKPLDKQTVRRVAKKPHVLSNSRKKPSVSASRAGVKRLDKKLDKRSTKPSPRKPQETVKSSSKAMRKQQAPVKASRKKPQKLTKAPSKKPQKPVKAPSKKPQAPAKAPSKKTQAPAKAPSKKTQAPAKAPSKKPQAPAKAPSKKPQAPAKAPLKKPQAPVKAPPKKPQKPAKAPLKKPRKPTKAAPKKPKSKKPAPKKPARRPPRKPPKKPPVVEKKRRRRRKKKEETVLLPARSAAAEAEMQTRLVALQGLISLLVSGLDFSIQTFINKDGWVDGELRIANLPEEWRTLGGFQDMVFSLSNAFTTFDPFDALPSMGGKFWISFGIRFGPQNEAEIGELAALYKRHRGLFQIGTYPAPAWNRGPIQIALTSETVGIKAMVGSLMTKRGMPPTVLLIRFIWSPDGSKPAHYSGEKGDA